MFYFRGARKPDFRNIKAIDYDKYWRTRGFELRGKLMERERIFFDWIPEGSAVFDSGCGNSRLLYELKTKKNCRVAGCDASPVVLEGQKRVGVEVYAADIEAPDFQIGGIYDYIIASEVLEHLRLPEELINKLSPHAQYLALSVPNSAFYRYRLGLMFFGRFATQWRYHPSEHLRFWSHKDFLEWLEAQNLQVEKFAASNGFWFKDFWPNLFGHQMCYLAKVGLTRLPL